MTCETESAQKWSQILPSLLATLGALGCGTVLAWPGSYIEDCIGKNQDKQLTSPSEKVGCNVNLTEIQVSLLSSLVGLGGICVGPLGALSMAKFGKKWTMVLASIPFVLGWILMVTTDDSRQWTVFVGRFLTGMSGGSFGLFAPAYTSEIAQVHIRGALCSLQQLMVTIGVFLVHVCIVVGLSWRITTWVCLAIPVLLGVSMSFMPQSPFYLIGQGKEQEARKSLTRLRGPKYDIDSEIVQIKEAVNESRKVGSISIKKLLTQREYVTPLCISLVLMFLQQVSGVNAIVAFIPTILEGSQILWFSAMQVIGTAVSILLVDRFGRRVLLIVSDVFMALSLSTLALCFILEDQYEGKELFSTLQLVSLMLYIFTFSIGFGPLPWVLNAELFPKEAKGPASAACASFNYLCAFLVVVSEQSLVNALKEEGTYFLFAALCGLGAVFVYFCVPETKGRSEEDMKRHFLKNKTPEASVHQCIT